MRHWFWLLITIACIVWYTTVSVYVGFKGIADIKQMLARLSEKKAAGEDGAKD
jgi:hypothetical protein